MEMKRIDQKDLGSSTQTTLHLSNKDKSFLTTDEIKQIVDHFENQGAKVMVRALNIERWLTVKSINDDFDSESFDDYYRNKVPERDVEKFTTFAQAQITVFKKK